MSTTYVLIAFIAAIVVMIVLISKAKLHPAMAILMVAIFLGLMIGTPFEKIIPTVEKGLADTLKSVAIIIVLGCLLGKVLEETGAAVKITETTIKAFGKRNVLWAIMASSAILGIPVWADSVVILLMPIVSTLALETGASMISFGGALYMGALVTASLVPPTPGPVAAAAFLKVPLGQAILWGLIVSVPGIIAAGLFYKSIKKPLLPKEEYVEAMKKADPTKLPSFMKSLSPIILPLVLIFANTFISMLMPKTPVAKFFQFIGSPLAALLSGVIFSMILVGKEWKTKKVLNDWVEDGLRMSAMPIMVTGLGGSLALFIKDAKIAEEIAKMVVQTPIPVIVIPILIALIIHVITGSNALGVMTAAALVEPMLATLGLSPLAAFLACASGALMFKHSNSSGFWVTTSMSNMTLNQGLYSVGIGSTIAGGVCSLTTAVLFYAGVI